MASPHERGPEQEVFPRERADPGMNGAREVSEYSPLLRFFLFCSGSDLTVVRQVPTERHALGALGGAILGTGVLAAISMSFALAFAFDRPWESMLPIAMLWGLLVFNLDRWLVGSYRPNAGPDWKYFRVLPKALFAATLVIPRLLLAAIFSLVIAEPLVIRIFEPEISFELDEEELNVRESRSAELDTGFSSREIARLQDAIDQSEALLGTSALDDSVREIQSTIDDLDGEIGAYLEIGSPSETVVAEVAALSTRRESLLSQLATAQQEANLERIDSDESLRSEISLLLEQQSSLQASLTSQREEAAATTVGRGLLARIDALGRIRSSSADANQLYYLIVALILVVDSLPVLGKWLGSLGGSPYDKVRSIEDEAAVARSERAQQLANARENVNLAELEFAASYVSQIAATAGVEREVEVRKAADE